MNRLTKTIVLTTAIAATTLSAIPAANADDRWRHERHHDRRGSLNAGEIAAIGVIGLAAGVIASSAINNPPPPAGRVYIDPPRDRDYYPDAPEPRYQTRYQSRYEPGYASGDLEPWSREWMDYCSDRYRSFNPRTGTYTGYDGRAHFCTAG